MKEFIRVVKKAASALHLGTKKSVSQLRRVSSTLNLRRHIREQRSIREGLRRNHMLCDSRESDEYDTTQPITELDILRYRYHHGANLGGVFVLEKFLAPNMFDGCEKDSENEAVMQWVLPPGRWADRLTPLVAPSKYEVFRLQSSCGRLTGRQRFQTKTLIILPTLLIVPLFVFLL